MTPESDPETCATTPTPTTATRGQRSGGTSACDQCRRRKLRCDGQQPQCGLCQGAGVVCEVTQRGVRGPKKGYLKALKTRVVQLEALLETRLGSQSQAEAQKNQHGPREQFEPQQLQQQLVGADGVAGSTSSNQDRPIGINATSHLGLPPPLLPTPPLPHTEPEVVDLSQQELPSASSAPSHGDIQMLLWSEADFATDLDPSWLQFERPGDAVPVALPPAVSTHPLCITSVVHAELDQLYFDRVHPSVPILHQRRYLSWSRATDKPPARTCLQHTMWTLAALLSVEYRDMVEPLYSSAKQLLESQNIEGNDPGESETALLLAWILLALCESMRALHRRSWMSAGRAFRMVQGLHFHEIDSPKNLRSNVEVEDPTEIEQRRRVFWMAYFLDHLLSIRNGWPVTLHEHVICTRLPAPDFEFQTGQHVVGNFLSEAMTDTSPKVRAVFNECLIMATICGRSLLRRQQQTISKAYGAGDIGMDGAEPRWWLDGILNARLQVLEQCYQSPADACDPLLLFAHVLAPAAVVYYCKGMMESLASPSGRPEPTREILEYRHRALEATVAETAAARHGLFS